ncbi:MAG TPA: DUF4931 domain-containing protein [Acidobacteriota bacterium]|nr:DUF4931 domain-containing protein [Acidobacteriota bacterium]
MNELRRDPVTQKWVIIDREGDLEKVLEVLRKGVRKEQRRRPAKGPCDFCPGNESSTRKAISEISADGQWKIRVIPNRNPVFQIEGSLSRRAVSMYDVMDALGAHEIIVENREHRDWDEMTSEQVVEILRVYHARMNDLSKDERLGHLFIYKNYGPSSQSTMEHPHSTLIASPSVPERVRRELDFTRRHFLVKERCLFCDIISEEVRRKTNPGVIRSYQHFVNISPYFASHPLETWILPRRHSSDFRTLKGDFFAELAQALQENLRAIKKLVGPLSYSLLLFTRPNKIWGAERDYWTTIDSDYHWHFKFIPRFPKQIGFHKSFSAGSGFLINQIPPEAGAELLRSML